MATVTLATALPNVELGAGASVQVLSGDPAASVTRLTVYGTYYAPGSEPPPAVSPRWLPIAQSPEDTGA